MILLHFLLIFTALLSTASGFTRISHRCKLMSQEKLNCFKPNLEKACCSNCLDSNPNCDNEQIDGFVFLFVKFIPCPTGVRRCRIENIETVTKSESYRSAIYHEKYYDLSHMLELRPISCFDTHILIGGYCLLKDGCKEVSVTNNRLTCTECMQGYFLTSNPRERCQKCRSPLYQDLNQYSTSPTYHETHCEECESLDKCKRCESNYFLEYKSIILGYICLPCPSNCQCDNSSFCKACTSEKYHYLIDKNNHQKASCVPCSEYLTEYIGTNFSQILARHSTKISFDDFIHSCKIDNHEQVIDFQVNSVQVSDIAGEFFPINVYKIHNSIIETCPNGCAICEFDLMNKLPMCLECENGFYLPLSRFGDRCVACNHENPDVILCDSIKLFPYLDIQLINPTQCKVNFLQPIQTTGPTKQLERSCSVLPTCYETGPLIDGDMEARGSCRRCIKNYHRVLKEDTDNFYLCVKMNDSESKFMKQKKLFEKCSEGYFYDISTETCQECPQYCIHCLSAHECVECDNKIVYSRQLDNNLFECVLLPHKTTDVVNCETFNFGPLSEDLSRPLNGFCKVCKPGSVPQRSYKSDKFSRIEECMVSNPNCILRSLGVCVNCQIGYYLNFENYCEQLPVGCVSFSQELNTCLSCKYGYSMIRMECVFCTSLTTINEDGEFNCLSLGEEIKYFNRSLKNPNYSFSFKT